MQPALAAVCCLIVYALVYRFYARHLGSRIFQLDPQAKTPAHAMRDGVDYVPCRRMVLFGHHYASIAGLAPMLGPAIAVIWGWLPGMLWVVLGTLFIGAVHDFGALVVSMRHRGMSIGKVAEDLIGRRAKGIFLLIILFLICPRHGRLRAHGVRALHGRVLSGIGVSHVLPDSDRDGHGLAGIQARYLGRAADGHRIRADAGVDRNRPGHRPPQPRRGRLDPDPAGLRLPPLRFCRMVLAAAAGLPQLMAAVPRVGASYVGLFVLRPEFAAPALDAQPAEAPADLPVRLHRHRLRSDLGLPRPSVVGHHVQADRQGDGCRGDRLRRHGGESLLGLLAVLACTAGFRSAESWAEHYSSWGSASGLAEKMKAFIDGTAMFLSALGVPLELAQAFIALVAVSFALTSLDSGTRLLRYNIEEISNSIGAPAIGQRHVASTLAVILIGFFAFYQIEGQPVGLALWSLFGSTNQVLGALTLLAVTIYLRQQARNYWYTLLPMAFMLTVTIIAMVIDIRKYWTGGQFLLWGVAASIFVLSVWLLVEAVIRFRKDSAAIAANRGLSAANASFRPRLSTPDSARRRHRPSGNRYRGAGRTSRPPWHCRSPR